jgi:hypothetical protein
MEANRFTTSENDCLIIYTLYAHIQGYRESKWIKIIKMATLARY